MSLPLLIAGGAALAAAATAYVPKTLAVWLWRRGLRPSDLGADIPLRAIFRTRVYDLDEVPKTWTWPNAWALSAHRDFLADPDNAQYLFPAPDHSIVIVRPLIPKALRTKAYEVQLVRHELWHLNNRGADSRGDQLHEAYARRFETDSAVPFALFPAGATRTAVR